MYKLISEYGNEIAFAEDDIKRDRLIDLGFKVVEEQPETEKKRTVGKGGKKNATENKDRAESNKP